MKMRSHNILGNSRVWRMPSLACVLAIVVLMLSSCRREPLYDDYGGGLYVEIEVHDAPARDASANATGMRATFFSPDSRRTRHTAFLPYTGGFVDVSPDLYHLMVYNYDTEYTVLRDEDHIDRVEAYTNESPLAVRRMFEKLMKAIAAARGDNSRAYADDPLIQQPDHLYVGNVDSLYVQARFSRDEVMKVHVDATTLLETYTLNISYINGEEYVQSIDVFITGQAPSKRLYDRTMTGEPSTIHLNVYGSRSETLSTTFRTFGCYPGEDTYVVLSITNLDGRIATWEWDVSDQVDSQDHVINIVTEIDVPIPTGGGGGLSPEVTTWEEVITNIVL